MTERKGSAGQPTGRSDQHVPAARQESDISFSADRTLKPSVSKKFGDLRKVMAAGYDRLHQYGTVRESDIQGLCGRFKGHSIRALRYIHQIHKDTDLSLINGEWCLSQKVRP